MLLMRWKVQYGWQTDTSHDVTRPCGQENILKIQDVQFNYYENNTQKNRLFPFQVGRTLVVANCNIGIRTGCLIWSATIRCMVYTNAAG